MKKNVLIMAALGLVSFVVYIFTMPPSIYTGDNGEIASAIYVWGIAHPTGFPAYTILAKLFSYLLPWLEFAHRLNIFSALMSAATVMILFLILRKMRIGYLASAVASLSLAFAYTFWSHAETIQVYSLMVFSFALVVLTVLHWLETRKKIYFYILAIICGIGAGTHLTFLLILPFIFVFVLIRDKNLITVKRFFLFIVLFSMTTTLVYSYIPLRAAQSPELNWDNPSNKENFIYYITQREYSEKIGTRSFESWKLMLGEVGQLFSREFTWFGLIFIFIGVIITFKKNKPFFYAGLSVVFFNILLLGNYGNSRDMVLLWRYFLPSYLVMAIFLGMAIEKILSNFKYASAGLILPLIIFTFHFKDLNHHNNFLVQETMQDVFEILPQGSIFMVAGDTFVGAANYKQIVLGQRQDLLILQENFFARQWYVEQKKKEIEAKKFKYADNFFDFIKNNKDARIYSLLDSGSLKQLSRSFYPKGMVYEYEIKNRKEYVSLVEIKKINDEFWQNRNLDFLENKIIDKEILAKEIPILYITAINNLGIYLINHGFTNEGIDYFEKSLNIRENEYALYNLMMVYNAQSKQEKALKYEHRLKNYSQK